MIPPFAWVGEFVPFFLRWGHKSQHVCHNVHKKSLARSLFYTCIYFELTKHLGCGFKVIDVFMVPAAWAVHCMQVLVACEYGCKDKEKTRIPQTCS